MGTTFLVAVVTRRLPMAEIARRYERGESSVAMGREFKVSHLTILTKLREMGVAIRSKNRPGRMTPERIDQLREMMIAGEKQEYIAAVLGVHLTTVTVHSRRLRADVRQLISPFELGGLSVKRCSKCQTARLLSDYRGDNTRTDGMSKMCKACEEKNHE